MASNLEIFEELKTIKSEIKKLSDKIELIELALIQEEEITKEEIEELKRLSKEAREKGIDWEKFKAKIGL